MRSSNGRKVEIIDADLAGRELVEEGFEEVLEDGEFVAAQLYLSDDLRHFSDGL